MDSNDINILKSLEVALDAALTVFKSGGSANAASDVFNYIAKKENLTEAFLFIRLDNIIATAKSGDQYFTINKPIEGVDVNLSRVSDWLMLAENNKDADFKNEVNNINNSPTLYSKGLKIFLTGLGAACFSRLAGCSWEAFPFVFIAGLIGQAIHITLIEKKYYVSIVTFIVGICAGLVAAFGAKLGFDMQSAVYMMISAVSYVIPGVVLIFGFHDALSIKFFTTGIQRLIFATLIILILFIAIYISKTLVGI